jgi:hypothetical protein
MRRTNRVYIPIRRVQERRSAPRYRAVASLMSNSTLDLEAEMRHNVFDKNGPGMVGVVLCYIAVVCFLAAVFYVFGL